MKRKCFAAFSFVLITTLVFVFAGCEKKGTASGGAPVKIVGYLLGDELVGMKDVMAELNKKFAKDINAELEIHYIGWGDLASKYPLVLASGDLDFIFTAPWSYYNQEAAKGAFKELTVDMIKTNMPRHYAALDPVGYKDVTITLNGKPGIYMIPTSSPDKKIGAFLIRKDLRLKYGIPEIKHFSEIEPYLAAIKKNEPSMTPMVLDNTYDVGQGPFSRLSIEAGIPTVDVYYATGSGLNVLYDFCDPSGTLHTWFEPEIKDIVISTAKKVKTWYDAGYINSDVFGNTVRSKESFAQGRSGVAFGNSVDLQSVMASAVDNGWDVEIFPAVGKDGKGGPLILTRITASVSLPEPRTLKRL
jgi:putative aldouronate transport system substrate-binding protein